MHCLKAVPRAADFYDGDFGFFCLYIVAAVCFHADLDLIGDSVFDFDVIEFFEIVAQIFDIVLIPVLGVLECDLDGVNILKLVVHFIL